MSIKSELSLLNETDTWGLVLFALAKLKGTNEYSSVSELSYVLDKKNMLRLCEYFGGCTITIPTIEEFEKVLYGLLMYEYKDVEGLPDSEVEKKLASDKYTKLEIKKSYLDVKSVLSSYDILPRGKYD